MVECEISLQLSEPTPGHVVHPPQCGGRSSSVSVDMCHKCAAMSEFYCYENILKFNNCIMRRSFL